MIASTIAGSSGSTVGAEPADDLAARADQELLEVPPDVTGVAVGRVGGLHELLVQRVTAVAVDLDLLEQREDTL